MRRSIVLLLVACNASEPSRPPAPPATVTSPVAESALPTVTLTEDAARRLAIQTAVVVDKDVLRTRRYPGRIEAVPGSGASISAPVAGVLLDSGALQPGTKVTKGQVVMRLRPLLAGDGDAVARGQRDVEIAKARVDAAKLRADRLAVLAKTGAASQRAADDAATELTVAEADLAEAGKRAGRARDNPFVADSALALRAPDTGTVLRLSVSPGQAVAAGTPLIEIARVDRAWVRVAVYAGDRERIAATAGSVEQIGGRTPRAITAVDAPALADPASSIVELVYAVDNADSAFLPGQRVLATLPLAGAARGAVIPLASVIYDVHGGAWVYTVDKPHTFSRRRIEIRDVLGTEVVLERGPKPGTTIVTAGVSELYGSEFGSK